MKNVYCWEDFPLKEVSYLAGQKNAAGIRIRIMSSERMMLTQINIQGGGTVPRHYHEAEQILIIQKGEAIVTSGDKSPIKLCQGDIWVIPSNVVHGVDYIGDVEALEMVSPPRLDNLTGYVMQHTFFENEH